MRIVGTSAGRHRRRIRPRRALMRGLGYYVWFIITAIITHCYFIITSIITHHDLIIALVIMTMLLPYYFTLLRKNRIIIAYYYNCYCCKPPPATRGSARRPCQCTRACAGGSRATPPPWRTLAWRGSGRRPRRSLRLRRCVRSAMGCWRCPRCSTTSPSRVLSFRLCLTRVTQNPGMDRSGPAPTALRRAGWPGRSGIGPDPFANR